jgi:hypothetical protein
MNEDLMYAMHVAEECKKRAEQAGARVKELEEELDGIAAHLEVRANDPWPDELWPAANVVLTQVARELRALRGEE